VTQSLGFFNLKVYIGHPFILEVHAGTSDSQAENPCDWFAVTADARAEILEEVLTKLAAALQGGKEAIDVNVNGKEILRDHSYPLTPPIAVVRAAAEVLRISLSGFERALAARTGPVTCEGLESAARKPPETKTPKTKRSRSRRQV
jgi:hypothetical protein